MNKSEPPAVGRNIFNYRKRKNMSLDEVAKRSGVSKSMLSQIEQEKTNPTVITVWKIAKALNITMEELINSEYDSAIEVLRNADAPVMYSADKSCIIRINSPIHMTDNLELYSLTFKVGGKLESTPHYPHAEEFLTVISGQFKVTSGNYSSVIGKGDTARYKADCNHCIENISDCEAEAYLVVWFPK